jgi:hypothetical protein
MTRIVTLQVQGFATKALERLTRDRGSSADGVFRTAALYYLGDRDESRPSWRAPRFSPAGRGGSEQEVTFDDATWAALEEESDRQRVAAEDLAVHALLYYVADLQSGRLSKRLDDVLKDEPQR